LKDKGLQVTVDGWCKIQVLIILRFILFLYPIHFAFCKQYQILM